MRTTLFGLLFLVLLAATWAMPGAVAEDEALVSVYRSFDVSTLVRAQPERWGGRLGSLAPWEAEPEPPKMPEAKAPLSGDELVEMIREFIEPESWEEDGVFIDFRGDDSNTIWVRQRPAVLERVGVLLDLLRNQAQARAHLSVEVDGGDATVVDSVSLDLPMGVRRFASATRRMQYVVDYEVEIAQGSNIADPTVIFPEDGLIVDARATPLLDGRRVLVEAVVQRGRYDDEALRRLTLGIDEECFNKPFRTQIRSHLGTLDLPSFDAANVHWTAVVASGETIEVPLMWNGTRHTIRVKADLQGGAVAGGPLLELASLGTRPFPCHVEFETEDYVMFPILAPRFRWLQTVRERRSRGSIEEVVDLINNVVRPEIWDDIGGPRLIGSRLVVVPEASGLRTPLKEFAAAQEARVIRPVVLDLRVVSVAGSTEARVIAAGRVPTISGRMASLLVGNTSNVLADYSVEVAQESRISDPHVGQSFDGLAANLVPRIAPDGRGVIVDVDLLLSIRTLDPDPPSLDAQFLGPLDRVETRRSAIDTEVVVSKDGPALIDLGLDPKDSSRRLVAELRASMP